MEFTGERFIPEKLKETDETYQEHMERYKFAVQYVKGMTVLDAACGVGYGSYSLSKEAKNLVGIDISQEAIAYAQSRYGRANIRYEVMDLAKLHFPDNYFDAVVSFETIEHIAYPEAFLSEIKKVLKPNGLLILSTPNKETVPKGKEVHVPFHVQEFTQQEMLELLKDFKDISIFSQKMTYHKRFYRKLRLFSRYANAKAREIMVSLWKGVAPEKVPIVFRIPIYEYAYKARVIPYLERNKYIKPTFFVMVCRA